MKRMCRIFALAFLFLNLTFSLGWGASLLPQGKQQFFSDSGVPLAGGSVYFYIPGTTTPKDTYQDSGATILNTNPVQLDSGGFALIYGSGAYRMIVKDATGATIYDQLTADSSTTASSWAGTATGTGNAPTVSATAFSAQDGQSVCWKNALTNTGPATVTIAGSAYTIVKDTLQGTQPLTGREMTAGNITCVLYDSTLGQMHLTVGTSVAPFVSVAAASTIDLASLNSVNISITGNTTITSFGSSAVGAGPLYRLVFSGTPTITYNATSMITPTGQSLVMKAGATVLAQFLGGGNWRILDYTIPSNFPTRQILTTGTAATYTTPSGVTRIAVRMVGGGGGGGGNGTANATAGGTGGTTSFDGSTYTAIGGSGGAETNNAFGGFGGAGGTGGAGTVSLRRQGTYGSAGGANTGGAASVVGGIGGNSFLGGGGVYRGDNNATVLAGRNNTGSGAAGAVNGATNIGGGGGGGAGEFVEFFINNPAASYVYTIGAGGTAGAAGTSGAAGGVGGSGVIIVDEYRGLD